MKVKIVNKSAYETPFYATEKSAGMDLKANITEPVTLGPLERAMVPTGLFIALPDGTEAQVRPRSGLAAKHGISVLNAPGTIDADYRGEIKVILVNLSNDPFVINPGERIAQMVVARYEKVTWNEVASLDETVLFSSDSSVSTFTTSEPIENFEYLKVIVEAANGVKAMATVVMTDGYTDYLSLSYLSPHTFGNGKDYYMWRLNYARSNDTYTWNNGAYVGYTGSAISSGDANNTRGKVYKVIGVNRVANN